MSMTVFQIEAVCTSVQSTDTKSGKAMLFLSFDNHLTVPVFGDSVSHVSKLLLKDKLCKVTLSAREDDKGFLKLSLIHVGVMV